MFWYHFYEYKSVVVFPKWGGTSNVSNPPHLPQPLVLGLCFSNKYGYHSKVKYKYGTKIILYGLIIDKKLINQKKIQKKCYGFIKTGDSIIMRNY